jgi:hypothetical protein
MQVNPISSAGSGFESLDSQPNPDQAGLPAFLKALSVARGLNKLIPEHHFAVLRDPRTGTVVIAIRYRSTGELIDVRQPDAMLDMLEHLPGCWTGIEE